MNSKAQRRIKRTLIGIVTFYITTGLVLYFIQDLLFFHPKPLPADYTFRFNQPFVELNIPIGDRNLNLIQFKATGPRKGIVLYFHGNMRNIERYAGQATLFTETGFEIWMVDYPGFGKSTGKRTEQVMYDDALRIYEIAIRELPAHQLIIYGRSIGTGVASYLASVQACRQLILETPYYNIETLARYYAPIFPVKALMNYRFPTNEYLLKVKAPITILHGTKDEIIPYRHAKRLAAIRDVQLITITGGMHNNLSAYPLFRQTLIRLLQL